MSPLMILQKMHESSEAILAIFGEAVKCRRGTCGSVVLVLANLRRRDVAGLRRNGKVVVTDMKERTNQEVNPNAREV